MRIEGKLDYMKDTKIGRIVVGSKTTEILLIPRTEEESEELMNLEIEEIN